jgi:hypothetical protein
VEITKLLTVYLFKVLCFSAPFGPKFSSALYSRTLLVCVLSSERQRKRDGVLYTCKTAGKIIVLCALKFETVDKALRNKICQVTANENSNS